MKAKEVGEQCPVETGAGDLSQHGMSHQYRNTKMQSLLQLSRNQSIPSQWITFIYDLSLQVVSPLNKSR